MVTVGTTLTVEFGLKFGSPAEELLEVRRGPGTPHTGAEKRVDDLKYSLLIAGTKRTTDILHFELCDIECNDSMSPKVGDSE